MNEGTILKGIGHVYIGDRNRLEDYVNFSINLDNKVIKYPASDSYDEKSINIGRNVSGSIEFRKLTANIVNLLTGGSLASGNSQKHYNEQITVPAASPYDVTLTNTPISNTNDDSLLIYSKSSTGVKVYWDKVTAGSEAAGKYSVSGDTVTFAAADAGTELYADYFYEGSSDAQVISYGGSADSLPAVFTLRGVVEMQTDSGASKTLGIYAKNCRITSGIDLGGAVQEVGSIKADFDVVVEDAGDFTLSFED